MWDGGRFVRFRGHVTGVLHHFTPQTSKIELTTVCVLLISRFQMNRSSLPLPTNICRFYPFTIGLTGEISEARLLQGKQTLTIDEKSILNYASTKQPASIGVDLCLEASWRWQRISFFDLWAEVAAQCSGEFATLTPDTFIQKWARQSCGYHLNRAIRLSIIICSFKSHAFRVCLEIKNA